MGRMTLFKQGDTVCCVKPARGLRRRKHYKIHSFRFREIAKDAEGCTFARLTTGDVDPDEDGEESAQEQFEQLQDASHVLGLEADITISSRWNAGWHSLKNFKLVKPKGEK